MSETTTAAKGNRELLLERLRTVTRDIEVDHVNHDDALLDFIGDAEVTEAFNASEKWYD